MGFASSNYCIIAIIHIDIILFFFLCMRFLFIFRSPLKLENKNVLCYVVKDDWFSKANMLLMTGMDNSI